MHRTADSLDGYRQIVAAGEQMLESARGDDWQRVERIALRISAIGDQITSSGQPSALSPTDNRERFRLLKRMVEIDAMLRHLRHPEFARLDRLLAPQLPRRHPDP